MVKGFSLVELMLALTITAVVGLIGFQIFRQNEHTFESQNSMSDVQQNARAVIFQINDDIRRTGQGVPIYSQTFEATASEAMAAVLNGSDATHLQIRENYSNVQADVSTNPSDYTINSTQTLAISDTASFYNELGTTSPIGRYAYVWASGANSCWSWTRILINNINNASGTMSVIPQQIGQGCRVSGNSVHLTGPATIALEQAVSIYLNGGSIWRKTASDMTNQTSPLWNAAAEIGRDFNSLTFTYYDANDNVIVPTTLTARLSIVRVDTKLQAVSGFGLSMRGFPVNFRIR